MGSADMNRVLACLALLSFAACHEATAPLTSAALHGDYVLTSVNGRDLPANIADASYPVMLLGDTIHFDGVYTATRHWTLRQPSSLQPAPLSKLSDTFFYDVAGTAMSFPWCPPGTACTPCPPLDACGRVGPDSGRIVLGLSVLVLDYGDARYLYRRVR